MDIREIAERRRQFSFRIGRNGKKAGTKRGVVTDKRGHHGHGLARSRRGADESTE